jgi:copper resistance protein C
MQYSRRTARAAVPIASAFVLVAVLGAPAFGHAALTGSTPKKGSTVDEVPASVEVSYAEPPTTDSRFTVTDGCGNDVASNVEVLNQSITADTASGQPGQWTIEWAVVSAVDGHATKDSLSFTVEGDTDCTQAGSTPPAEEGGGDQQTSFPVLPIAAGTILIIGVALLVRSRSN